jgi:Family of unknown function (DUF6221)
MDDLVAFVRARLDEYEAAANEIHRPRDCGSVDRDGEFDPNPIWRSCGYPARVRREVAALRRILAEHDDPTIWHDMDTLRPLAAIWDDHSDYRPEWKP